MTMTATTVAVTVNSKALVKALRDAFTTSMTVIAELLQNARRAGSTKAEITYDAATKTLTVVDDGCGIGDFSVLLRLAESGWDAETMERESPFGLGAVSCYFACETLEIISSGQRLCAKTADLIALNPVVLESVPATRGTRIVLHNISFEFSDSRLEEMVVGFALPVYFNGKALARPDAQDSEGFIETPVGRLRLGGSPTADVLYYVQGFRVGRTSRRWDHGKDDTIVHLDSRQFRARVPDRSVLVDSQEAERKITAAVEQAWFEALVADVDMGRFDRPAAAAVWLGQCAKRRVLLNRLPFVPEALVSEADDSLLICADLQSCHTKRVRLFRTDLPTAKVVTQECAEEFLQNYSHNAADMNVAPELNRALYCIANKALVVDSASLARDHWLMRSKTLMNKLRVRVGKVSGRKRDVQLSGHCVFGVNITPCKSVELAGPWGSITTDSLPVALGKDASASFVAGANFDTSLLLYLFSQYRNEDDYWQQEWFDADSETLATIVAAAKAGNSNGVLLQLLSNASRSPNKDFLAGKSFAVTFNKDGRAEVVERKAA